MHLLEINSDFNVVCFDLSELNYFITVIAVVGCKLFFSLSLYCIHNRSKIIILSGNFNITHFVVDCFNDTKSHIVKAIFRV